MSTTEIPHVSAQQIAVLLKVGARTVRDWRRLPDFPQPVGKTGRAFLYSAPDVVFWWHTRELAKRATAEGDAPDVYDLSTERARLARLQADEKEMQIRERRGELVAAGRATSALAAAVLTARSTLLSVQGKCAAIRPDLPPEVLEEIRRLHHDALTELAQAPLPDKAKRERINGTGARAAAI